MEFACSKPCLCWFSCPDNWLVTSPGSIPRLSPTVCWQRLQLTCNPNEANRYRKWKHLKQQAHFHDMSEILANEWPLPCCSEHFMLRWKEICTSINVTFHHLFIYRPDPTTVVIRHLKVHVFKRANRSSVNYFQSRILVTIQQVLHIFMTDSCCQRPPWRRIVRGEGGGGGLWCGAINPSGNFTWQEYKTHFCFCASWASNFLL